MTIVNFMPAHKQAPVALWLLRNDVEAAARAVLASGAEAALVPAGEPCAPALAEALGDAVRVVECSPDLGFVYANGSAAAKVLKGEKPIPSCAEGECEDRSMSAAELLSPEGKRWVWAEGAAAPVLLDKSTTVGDRKSVV